MNEELRIIIRAITDEAKRNMAQVREELEKIEGESKQTEKAVDKATGAMVKGAVAAVAAITALTTAMAALGKKAQEVEKGFAKLNTTFLNAGTTTQQAATTYKELFGFLGDHDKAIETAQSLALMTSEEEKLAEWTNVLQGAFAQMGDKLPIEGLAEAANETMNVGTVVGVMADALNWAGISEDNFNAALANTTSLSEREALIRNTLNSIYGNAAKIYEANNQATIQYNQSQANLNLTLAQAAGYTTPLLTALNQLSTSLLTLLAPALQTVAIYLTAFIQLMAEAIQWVGSFFGMFSSSSQSAAADVDGYRQAVEDYQASLKKSFGGTNVELDKNLNKINAVKKAVMGFDELNVVSNPVSSGAAATPSVGGAGGGISVPTAPNPADYGIGTGTIDMSGMIGGINEAKEKMEGLLVVVGLVAAGMGAWKLADFIVEIKNAHKAWNAAFPKNGSVIAKKQWKDAADNAEMLHNKIKGMIGTFLAIGGALVAIAGYSDAWANGVDWGNMAMMIGGVAAALGGLYIAYGKLALGVGAAVASIALVVVYLKDFSKNGPTWQNTIILLGAAVAAAIALATAGLSVLVAAIVAAVAAIGVFVAGIFLEEEAIMSVDEAKQNHKATIEALMNAEVGYTNAIDAAESAMNRLAAAEEAAGMTGSDLYAQVQAGTLTYSEMTDEQKELYKAYLDNEQKQKEVEEATKALTDAKKAETLASFESQLALAKESGSYDEFKASVVDAFESGQLSAEEARDLLAKSMSEMSDDAQKTFMEDLPGSIKEGLNPSKYETTRKKITDWFKQAWKDIKGFFSDAGEWFGKVGRIVGEAISNAFKEVINWILGKIEQTVNAPFKLINNAIDILNAVPGVSITKLAMITVPRLAKGGITTGSTLANIGEAGREAVLPLENNTGWMDTLADRIAARNNAPSRIVLQVDGKELGYATINSINGITKQTGTLQLITI